MTSDTRVLPRDAKVTPRSSAATITTTATTGTAVMNGAKKGFTENVE